MSRLAVAAALLLGACTTVQVAEHGNPVLDRDFPDPAVLRDADGRFYAYATQSAADGAAFNIQVARSADLVQWEFLGDALPDKPAWAAKKQVFWAPHVVRDGVRGRYVMYYSAEPDASKGKCLAVATAQAAVGPFVDSGAPLVCGEGIEHIDPMAFDDPNSGKQLLYWGSGGKAIKVRELAPDRMHFLPGSAPQDVVFPDASRQYRALVEAPWVVFREGYYYLFYSGDRCCAREPRYAVMVARSRKAEGPFEDLEAPILERYAEWLAPGHVSVVSDRCGADWMLYHAIRVGEARGRRVMLLNRIVYRDGWPSVVRQDPSLPAR